MYKFINENAEAILEEAENTYKDGLRGYVECYLKTLKWEELNSANKKEYIRNYKKFYAMNAARLSSEFYNKYFGILCSGEEKKLDELIKDESGSIHFSFTTKLLHTLNQNLPIYDKYIAAFFLFPDWQDKNAGKESICNGIYEFLKYEYQRIQKEKLLPKAIEIFKTKVKQLDLKNAEKITDEKIIDFFIWQFSKMMKDSKQMNGNGFRKKIRYE